MTLPSQLPRMFFFTLTFLAVLLMLSGLSVGSFWMTTLLIVLVTFMGLPHGAADPWVAFSAKLWSTRKGLVKFLAVYLVLVGGSALGWRMFPLPALCLFLLISWVHFSGDWREDLPLPLRLCVSGIVLTGSSWLYGDQVRQIFHGITFGAENSARMVDLFHFGVPVFVAGIGWAAYRFRLNQPGLSLELLILGAAALFLPPLLFFITYFCGLHSTRHLQDTFGELSPHLPLGQILLVTLLTLPLALLAYQFMPADTSTLAGLHTLVFGGLFALTVPHMLLVEWQHRTLQYAQT